MPTSVPDKSVVVIVVSVDSEGLLPLLLPLSLPPLLSGISSDSVGVGTADGAVVDVDILVDDDVGVGVGLNVDVDGAVVGEDDFDDDEGDPPP
eukprot:CAMPEP_0203678760 /NCGR_PEP_ID=MMETSP0090-20130426/33167_1 /ASSEMBLY_ACC=CAM_ASM_001088 /TAXON_ID=426623 /ORGANISM="Chaetoceros affinis, Strain CCMP159" /LENGTH=92 /DNA_ID=CAMNT_0050546141 /DNA_START=85 /DNA_END=359 /DNA_ORIENTATION=-